MKNHGVPLPESLTTNPVYAAMTEFMKNKSPEKQPLEAGVVDEHKIYDGLGRVEQKQEHQKLMKEVKEMESAKKRKIKQEEKQLSD